MSKCLAALPVVALSASTLALGVQPAVAVGFGAMPAISSTSCSTPGRAVVTLTNGKQLCYTGDGVASGSIARVRSVYAGKWTVYFRTSMPMKSVQVLPNRTYPVGNDTISKLTLRN